MPPCFHYNSSEQYIVSSDKHIYQFRHREARKAVFNVLFGLGRICVLDAVWSHCFVDSGGPTKGCERNLKRVFPFVAMDSTVSFPLSISNKLVNLMGLTQQPVTYSRVAGCEMNQVAK